jgi:hypothetical protein
MRKLGNAQEAFGWATSVLARCERSNSDIEPLRNEEQEGYGIFNLKLGMREMLYNVTGKYDRALTIVAVVARIPQHKPKLVFEFLYGNKDDDVLHELAGTLYQESEWPFRPDHRLGVNICRSILLRHYWYKNERDYYSSRELEREPQLRTLSPTVMSKMLSMPFKKDRRTGRKRPFEFMSWQKAQPQYLPELWERQAESFVNDVLAGKGYLGG